MFSLVAFQVFSAALVQSREISFPPIAAIYGATGRTAQAPFLGTSKDSADFSSLEFGGLTTFANLPFEHCLSKTRDVSPYDIAFLGAPFDTGVTARPGARYGPRGIRTGSQRIVPEFSWDPYTGRNSFLEWAKIVDCGDAPLTFLDNTVALKQLDEAHKAISARPANSTTYKTPRIITLGGDHTTTLPALRSVYEHFGKVSVIHFDSHIDTWDPKVLGGGISHYAGVNHGTFLHLAAEEGLISNASIHAGLRAPLSRRKGDMRNDVRCGFDAITAREIDHVGTKGISEKIKERVKGNKVYISVDIDVLDPAYAPATGTSEVGGWSTRELLTILDGLDGLEVVGADVVEVAPVYDNAGETTVLAASEVARVLMTLMVNTPVLSLADKREAKQSV